MFAGITSMRFYHQIDNTFFFFFLNSVKRNNMSAWLKNEKEN